MKKTKKVLSLILGAVMAAGAVNTFSADAETKYIDASLKMYNGYEVYEDSAGLFQNVEGSGVSMVYYKEYPSGNGTDFMKYYRFRYNDTVFTVVNEKMEEFDTIYEKYSESLDMYYFNRNDPPLMQPDYDVEARIQDRYDENGNDTKDSSDVVSKYDEILEMTTEMYRKGCISEASYRGMTSYGTGGYYKNIVNVKLNTDSDDSELDAVTEIANKFSTFTTIDYNNGYYSVGMKLEETADFLASVKEVYPETTYYLPVICLGLLYTHTSEPIDLIAEVEQNICDTDGNGTVEITDATAVLQSYANTAAGIAAASAENPMDVNGDGAVGIDDATFVLTVYAELAAGMR